MLYRHTYLTYEEQLVCHIKIRPGSVAHISLLHKGLGELRKLGTCRTQVYWEFSERINFPLTRKILPVLTCRMCRKYLLSAIY